MNYRTECLEIKNIYDKSEGNNMRLIDADALMRVYQEVLCPYVSCADCSLLTNDGNCRFETMIREAPAIDAVSIVRCRECKHLNVVNRKELYAYCPKTNTVFLPFELDTREHFCSLGERKEDTD